MEGRGAYTWKSGEVYEGEMRENEMVGQGKLLFQNNVEAEGQWKSHRGGDVDYHLTGHYNDQKSKIDFPSLSEIKNEP